jgi:hypothetical protein
MDSEFGPTGVVSWEAPVTIPGQVRYNKYDHLIPTGSGDDPASEGHIVFLEKTWTENGGKVGDEMELSPSSSRLVVVEIRPAVHYLGRAWHVHVLFSRKRVTA